MIKDVAEVEKGKSLKAVYKYHHIPDNALAHNFLEMVRDGVKPLKVMGEKYVSMTEAERMQSGISKTILSDIVKDAWQAAKVVMAEGIKIDLKKELGQAENFSKINDKRRTEPEKKGKSKIRRLQKVQHGSCQENNKEVWQVDPNAPLMRNCVAGQDLTNRNESGCMSSRDTPSFTK